MFIALTILCYVPQPVGLGPVAGSGSGRRETIFNYFLIICYYIIFIYINSLKKMCPEMTSYYNHLFTRGKVFKIKAFGKLFQKVLRGDRR